MDYRRGDIFYVDFCNPNGAETVGSEMRTGRPAVIVSSDHGNRSNENVIVVYLTSQEKRPMTVNVPVMCKVPSTALCSQIYTVSKERLRDYVRSCTDEEMQDIDAGILCALGLNMETRKVDDDAHRIRELEAEIDEAELDKAALQAENADLDEKLGKAEETIKIISAEKALMLAGVSAERDVYKKLYEQLLEKMFGKGA